MKNLIILNEKNYIEDCLKSNRTLENPYYDTNLFIRYQFFFNSLKPKQIKNASYEFLNLRYPAYVYNKPYWDEYIESAIKKAKRQPLRELDGVWITKAELETIGDINNKVLERLAFVLLCLAKYSTATNPKANGWVNFEAKLIYSLARINCTVSERYQKFSKLYGMGLIELPKKNDNLSVRVAYTNNDSDNVLFIDDFRELGYEYLKHKGENYIRCAECGRLIKANKRNTRRYCPDCAAYTPQQFKTVVCIDCGKEFRVDARLTNKCRCDECQDARNRDMSKERMRKFRSDIQI